MIQIQKEIQNDIDSFKEQLHRLDTQTRTFTKKQKEEYQKYREVFAHRIAVWEKKAESDWDSFAENIAEGFRELEAQWWKIKNK